MIRRQNGYERENLRWNSMLCPLCQQQGGDKVADTPPFEHWKCRHCLQNYPVYQGYPVHPAALPLLAEGATRCPACGGIETEPLAEAPEMGKARVFRCAGCEAIFPALLPPAAAGQEQPDPRTPLIPVHPQAMVETVTGLERLPTFYILQQRLREYLEQTGFVLARSEDKMDLDTQVRSFSFYFAPETWVQEHPERAAAAQGSLTFLWHAGQAQFAGTPPTDLSSPVPLVIGLGVAMNPAALAESVPAYLRLVQGLGTLLEELEMAGNALIDAELAIHPDTQAATIRRLAAMRQLTIDMASPADWLGLIGELHRLKPLLEKTWELVAAQEG